ncbi:hypothetical protein JCM16814_31560 [Desulfobaculum senezii]|jgi:hypothetical protein|uniref:hypothetical protein n=1 Tax=Desulfobaculum sp. SPO524 TaxID=3378071 RepID=UPI0038546DE6
MIEKSNVLRTLLERLSKLEIGHAVDIRTYKRDRSAIFVRLEDDLYRVLEDGFEQHDVEVPYKGLRKEIKRILRVEFPRSNKVRMYALGRFKEAHHTDLGRKRI